MTICAMCGKVFQSDDNRVKFCSDECRKTRTETIYREKMDKILDEKRTERLCDHCGSKFTPVGRRNIGRNRFCSAKCRQNFKNKERWEKIKPPDPEPRPCIICGKVFVPSRGHSNAKTCSIKCNTKKQQMKNKAIRDQKRNEILNKGRKCKYCGKEFIPQSIRKMYCSGDCNRLARNTKSREYASRLPEGEKTRRNYQKRWNGNFKLALERDDYKCQLCGKTEGLNVHHLDGDGEKHRGKKGNNNSALENLITLCIQCHKDIHGIFLIDNGDGWVVDGPIFKKLGLSGTIRIKANNLI